MRWLSPGSLAWLILHEVRLTFRSSKRSRAGKWVRLALLGLFLLLGVQLAVSLHGTPIVPSPKFLVYGSAVLLVVLSFMTTQTLIGAQRTLFDKTDLDLLLSSPLPESRVLAAKLLGLAASAAATYALLTLPLVLPVAIFGHPRLLAWVPVLASFALLAASLGLGLSIVLVRVIGPRAAKTAGQVLAAALGGLIYLLSQMSGHSNPTRGRLMNVAHWMQESGWGTKGWSAWPARGLFGEGWPLLGTALASILLFGVTTILFKMHFLASYQKAGDRSSPRAKPGAAVTTRFAGTLFAAVLAKEIRLLVREPGLLFMMLLRLIYLMPMLFIGVKNGGGITLPMLAAVGVVAAGQLCGGVAWLTISAEDAPDLLAVAPVETAQVKRMKLLSALLVVVPVALIMPAVIALRSPAAGLVAFAGSLVAGYAAGLIEMMFGKPAKRSAFANRRQGSLLTSLLGIFVSLAVAGATAAAVYFL
jgi:ABC-2 type transport system permease protein